MFTKLLKKTQPNQFDNIRENLAFLNTVYSTKILSEYFSFKYTRIKVLFSKVRINGGALRFLSTIICHLQHTQSFQMQEMVQERLHMITSQYETNPT